MTSGRAASSAATSSSASPTITTIRRPDAPASSQTPPTTLPSRLCAIEVSLAGDDDVRGLDPLLEVDVLGDEVEPADEAPAERGETAGETRRPHRLRRAR